MQHNTVADSQNSFQNKLPTEEEYLRDEQTEASKSITPNNKTVTNLHCISKLLKHKIYF